MIDHYLASLGLIASIVDASLACDVARDVKLSEHCQAESLFPREVATSVAVRSGDWSESSTWRPAMMPQAGARILIPEGVSVCLGDDYSGGGAVEWIRIEGELRLLADRDTGVKVGTMFVAEGGLFEIGTREERVAVGNCARVVFAARPPRESLVETDPQDLSGGLIVFGRWQVFGAQRTAFMMARTEVVRGSSEVSFDIAPAGWRVGDQLLFPGISAFVNEDELRSIAKISLDGRRFFLDAPLKFSHSAGKDRSVPIGNLTRNVLFESEVGSDAEQIHQRGHIMVMHSQTGTCLEGAGFHRLGRTRADRVHTRPMMGVDGVVVTGSDANPIGRYALHFHGRTGVSRRLAPQEVRDCVIMDSPKHGLVNHGGHVLAEGNVTYRIAGSHFFGENGSEIGVFSSNLAVCSEGSGEDLKSRMYSADMGHTGHGFWMQGGGIDVIGNYAFGHRDAAFIYHMKPSMTEGGVAVKFAAENLIDPRVALGAAEVDPADVPIYFADNVAAACGSGLTVRYHQREALHAVTSVFERSEFWNMSMERHAVDLDYSRRITLRDVMLIGDVEKPRAVGILSNGESGELVCENVCVEGFDVGIIVPRRGVNMIVGGNLSNRRNVFIQQAVSAEREVVIREVKFGNADGEQADRFDVVLLGIDDWLEDRKRFPARWHADELSDVSKKFVRDEIWLDGRRLYYSGQAVDARPLALIDVGLGELGILSAGELFRDHGLAIAGRVAPPGAMMMPGIFGLVGELGAGDEANDAVELESSRWTKQLKNYVPETVDLVSGKVIAGQPCDLKEGWNLVKTGICGRSVLVYGDTTPPQLKLMNLSLKIHPADLEYGFLVEGRVIDWIGGVETDRKYRHHVESLSKPVGGVIKFTVPVVDLAGNSLGVPIALQVSETAHARQGNLDDWGSEE